MLIVLTMRKGKVTPTTENNTERWLPVMANAARRSDWTKSSLLSVITTPPDEPEVMLSQQGPPFTITELCGARTRPSIKDD